MAQADAGMARGEAAGLVDSFADTDDRFRVFSRLLMMGDQALPALREGLKRYREVGLTAPIQ